ncbi:MAG: Gfo/Idh/MocA family oxidoreductase [Flavobacteriales bacterium]|nr:Gfo/Idh/MocA family oxidoreductase [Flavobacteriales bacterium]
MYKTGVLGAGHLGKIHINILKEVDFTDLIGFYDTNPQTRKEVASLYGIKAYDNLEELIENCDIVDVVTPTLSHYECAKKALQATKHVFIEKPVTQTLEESKSLVKLVEEAGTKVQVGHVERFNPAFKKAIKHIENPLFIETHRLAQFNPRGTDVSVVLDLMIHDIDIVLSVVKSPVNNIQASGVSIASKTPDIANARIEFSNGCVANLTASRFSMKKMRKSRFFQKNAYVAVDFLKKNFEVIQMKDITNPDPLIPTIDLGELGKKQLHVIKEDAPDENAIKEELKAFVNAINNNEDPIVDLYSAQQALSIANEISLKISKNSSLNSYQ